MSADDLRALREPFKAAPDALLDPQAGKHMGVALLTRSRVVLMGSGDLRPPVRRPGSMDFAALPSLMNGRLVYPEPRP